MAKRGLSTILKKNKLKAEEIFCIVLDDYLEILLTEESLLSPADLKKLQNSLIETTEERQAYNKLVPIPGLTLFGELAIVLPLMENYITNAEAQLQTLCLILNDKRILTNFIEILTEYYPKIITEAELEEEKKRRIERNLEKYSTLEDILCSRLYWYMENNIKPFTHEELKKILERIYQDGLGEVIKDSPKILNHALQDIKEKILEKKITLINRFTEDKKPYNDFNNVEIDIEGLHIRLEKNGKEVCTLIPSVFRFIEISNRELYNSGLPEQKERMEDIFNEKGYWPDSWIQDIAIYKPMKEYGVTKDRNIDEKGFFKKDISIYDSMLELPYANIFERQNLPSTTEEFYTAIFSKINEYMKQAYAYYNAMVIFSEKTNMPKLKEYIDEAKESVEFKGLLFFRYCTEDIGYMREHNISMLDPLTNGKPAIFKPAFTPESKIEKARALSNNTPLTKYSIREIAEVLGAKV